MEKIKIVTDSCSDITLEQEAMHPCLQVLNFKVTLGDVGFTSRVDMTSEQFYDALSKTDIVPTTSQITPFEFEELYRDTRRAGYTHVIVVLINSEASATYSNAVRAKSDFMNEHPTLEGKFTIEVVDSRTYTGGYGLPVLQACEMVEQGKKFNEVLAHINYCIDHSLIYFAMYTLKYAKKSGRIPGAVAVVGETLGIKPIMLIKDHEIVTDEMVRGEKKLIGRIADKTMDKIDTDRPYCIVYGNNPRDGEQMAKVMTERMGCPPTMMMNINPIVSSHAGPSVVGVIFLKK